MMKKIARRTVSFAFVLIMLLQSGAFTSAARASDEDGTITLWTFESGPDTPYPYSWTEKGGKIQLTLDGSAFEDGAWSSESDGYGVVELTVGEPKKGKTNVTIHVGTPGVERMVDWEVQSSDEAVVSVLAVMYVDDGLKIYLSAESDGTADITVSGPDAGYVFTVEAKGNQLLLTDSHPTA